MPSLGRTAAELLFRRSSRRSAIEADLARWSSDLAGSRYQRFREIFSAFAEFRSLFYYRIGQARGAKAFLRYLARARWPGQVNLYLNTPEIGPGLFILHGFSTILSAKRIGSQCWIHQQTTIGYTDPSSAPDIGNQVYIGCGAIILGNIRIGDGSRIGAGAVVLQDVPPGATAVGVPARILSAPLAHANQSP